MGGKTFILVRTCGLSIVRTLTSDTTKCLEKGTFLYYIKSMDYVSHIKHSYNSYLENIDSVGAVYGFLDSGNTFTYQFTELEGGVTPFDSLCYRVANYVNNSANQINGNLVAFLYSDADGDIHVISSTKLDFVIIGNSGGLISAKGESLYGEDSAPLEDTNILTNYAQTTANSSVSSYTYGGWTYTKSISSGSSNIVFDYTNIKQDNGDYYGNSMVVRGENISFYRDMILIDSYDGGLFSFSYGSPYSDIREMAYNNGQSNGFARGYAQGVEYGYQTGLNAGNNSQTETRAFSFIGQAFSAVGGIMNLEILPHVTLGLAFSIPLVFVLIMVIFKLVRK